MKLYVEEVIARLRGKALWACTRAADLAAFQFGEKREALSFHGRKVEIGEYALHVQCAWRITRNGRVVVGDADLYYPPDLTSQEIPLGFNWDEEPNRRDKLLNLFFEDGRRQFTVQSIDVGDAGSFLIIMDDGISLEVVPNSASLVEHWRLFRPRSDEPHFVFNGTGVEAIR